MSELVGGKLHSLAATLHDCDAASLSPRECLSEMEADLRSEKEGRTEQMDVVKKQAAKSCDDAEGAIQPCAELQDSIQLLPKQLKSHVSEQIEDELIGINEKQEDMSRYTMSLAERIAAFEQPGPHAEKCAMEELRTTITSFDTEIESANARIGELETSVGKIEISMEDGIHDGRLTGLELQLEESRSAIMHWLGLLLTIGRRRTIG